MKVRVTILAENDVPVSQLGNDPEGKIRMALELLFAYLSAHAENGDKAIVEKIEVLHETD